MASHHHVQPGGRTNARARHVRLGGLPERNRETDTDAIVVAPSIIALHQSADTTDAFSHAGLSALVYSDGERADDDDDDAHGGGFGGGGGDRQYRRHAGGALHDREQRGRSLRRSKVQPRQRQHHGLRLSPESMAGGGARVDAVTKNNMRVRQVEDDDGGDDDDDDDEYAEEEVEGYDDPDPHPEASALISSAHQQHINYQHQHMSDLHTSRDTTDTETQQLEFHTRPKARTSHNSDTLDETDDGVSGGGPKLSRNAQLRRPHMGRRKHGSKGRRSSKRRDSVRKIGAVQGVRSYFAMRVADWGGGEGGVCVCVCACCMLAV